MAKKRTARLENGHKQNILLPKKRSSYEHYRLEYAGFDKARKKTLATVSTFLALTATLFLFIAQFFSK